MSLTWPGYLQLLEHDELGRRSQEATAVLADCCVCPRLCHVDRRLPNPKSYCLTGREAIVSSAFAHHGEEDCLRGWKGSGTIFFSQCNLRCVFCQNFDISWEGQGHTVSARQLADLMLALQDQGCHNINLVTPSHVVPQILESLIFAAEEGLRLPLVYNTGGYDRVETLKWLDGVVDIYMPDFKFWNPATARELANAADYPEVARAAIKEMHRQVGNLLIDDHGLAYRGLLVRHLVMPNGSKETRQILRFLAREISPETFVNIMPQYRPAGMTAEQPAIDRPLQMGEYEEAIEIAREEGLWHLARD
jgi:putative pyruvate formate lyase activating enzyme